MDILDVVEIISKSENNNCLSLGHTRVSHNTVLVHQCKDS